MGTIGNIFSDNQFSKEDAEAVRDAINDNDSRVSDVEVALSNVDPSATNKITMYLPPMIYGVVGDTIQLFFRGMTNAIRERDFYFQVYAENSGVAFDKIGWQYERYYELTPEVAGDWNLRIKMFNSARIKVAEANTVLSIKPAGQNPAAMINAVISGTSMDAEDLWRQELLRRVTGLGGAPVGRGFSNLNVINESVGGKNTTYFNGNQSPFWNAAENKLDFQKYVTDNSLSSLDVVFSSHGYNEGIAHFSGGDGLWNQVKIDAYKVRLRTFADALHTDFPNAKLVLMSQPFLAEMNHLALALGDYYGDPYSQNYNLLLIRKANEELTQEPNYSSFVEHIDVALQYDSRTSNNEITKARNTRDSRTEVLNGGGYHNGSIGQNLIADAVYRWFICKFCQ